MLSGHESFIFNYWLTFFSALRSNFFGGSGNIAKEYWELEVYIVQDNIIQPAHGQVVRYYTYVLTAFMQDLKCAEETRTCIYLIWLEVHKTGRYIVYIRVKWQLHVDLHVELSPKLPLAHSMNVPSFHTLKLLLCFSPLIQVSWIWNEEDQDIRSQFGPDCTGSNLCAGNF